VDNSLFQLIPKQGTQIVLVSFLSFLIGLEREEQKAISDQYHFGGVRTFPLLGLFSYALCLFSGGNPVLPSVGLAVVGLLLWQSFRHKLERASPAGMTTEISGLITYAIGALVWREEYWIATTLTVLGVVLLELKSALENLTKRVPGDEILTFAKFLLLTAVILPVVPNRTFGTFGFNPFKAWLVVVAVSAVSYASYLLQGWTHGRGGVLLAALLGGAYSSTVTTVVLAKQTRRESRPHLYAGSTLLASGMMYLRLFALVGIFNHQLLRRLALPFLLLAVVGLLGGWAWTRIPESGSGGSKQTFKPKNPLELSAALLFGILFVALLLITHLSVVYLGRAGLYTLAGVMGVTDVDPFILSVTESAATLTPVALAAGAILIAAASNNLLKGIYAYGFGERRAGLQGLALLTILALLGILPLLI
jgi:uncharacterized membrane protein (DUF4010 family)